MNALVLKNVVMLDRLTGTYYFVRKAHIYEDGSVRPVGQKHDVTEHVEAIVEKAVEEAQEAFKNAGGR